MPRKNQLHTDTLISIVNNIFFSVSYLFEKLDGQQNKE